MMSLKKSLNSIDSSSDILTINGENISALDSAGVLVLCEWMKSSSEMQHDLKLEGFKEEHLKLIDLIRKSENNKDYSSPQKPSLLVQVGIITVKNILGFIEFLSFIGEMTKIFFKFILHPKFIKLRSIIGTIETTGVYALPIIALLSFLIGVVLAYQMAAQLRHYGANIYIVDLLGLSLLREFSPLMTAIIIAGRSGSAFTAQLGTMKIREEMDALKTMGLSPIELLVIPRCIGMFLVLPLLTVWSSIFGVLGGMTISHSMLNIAYIDFLHRFYEVIKVKSYISGMIKAPVFGLIIAAIGCYQGMKVSGSAASVGEKTTTSVVQSIFFIIVADAIFSILFKWFKF
jgi:phospholipid/cholesterol/gamma-HCH transport system permease protein